MSEYERPVFAMGGTAQRPAGRSKPRSRRQEDTSCYPDALYHKDWIAQGFLVLRERSARRSPTSRSRATTSRSNFPRVTVEHFTCMAADRDNATKSYLRALVLDVHDQRTVVVQHDLSESESCHIHDDLFFPLPTLAGIHGKTQYTLAMVRRMSWRLN